MDVVREELAEDPTIDITTTGRRSGESRRIEIWMFDIDGRFFIAGSPGPRGVARGPHRAPGIHGAPQAQSAARLSLCVRRW